MSQQQQQQQQTLKELDWKRILSAAGPYPIEAFQFVREGLSYTAEKIYNEQDGKGQDRHVSGQQLCMGLRDFAIERYGLLAPTVFSHWNVTRTDDFGRIVFAMIEEGLMSRTDEDSPQDFRAVYDFDEAFCRSELLARIGSQ